MASKPSKYKFASDYTAILSGYSWNNYETVKTTGQPTFITYSFPKIAPSFEHPSYIKHWRPFSKQDIKDAKAALKQWGDASGITFLEVSPTSQSDIKFNWTLGGTSGVGFYPFPYNPNPSMPDEYTSHADYSGAVYLNREYKKIFQHDSKFKKHVLLHEIGHALGLKHPFSTTEFNNKISKYKYDSTKYSVMSYTSHTDKYEGTKLGSFDKKAIQALYGKPNQDGSQASAHSWDKSTETLTQIGWNIGDRLRGTSVKDVLYGKDGDDKLQGFAGDDFLSGGSGSDVLMGGPGRDSFVFDTPSDGKMDRIIDFDLNDDRILLSKSVFAALGSAGQLDAAAFHSGLQANDASDRIIVDQGFTSTIFYDADGTGPTAQIAIARFTYIYGLEARHFFIV